jgi:hypothetical protein
VKLSKAASHFDKTVCADTANPGTTFLAQLDVFDDSKRDGPTVARRILSVDPAVSMPAGRVLTIAGEQWLVGTHQADQFRGATIRDKYILHRALGAATVRTAAEAIASTGGTSTYAGRLWVKDIREQEASSSLTSFLNVFLPSPVAAAVGAIIGLSGKLHLVRNSYLSAAGFTVAEVDELASAVVAGTYTPRTYTAATDTEAAGTPVPLNLLPTRFFDDYAYATAASEKFEPGDVRALIRKVDVAAPKAKDILAYGGVTWRVFSVADEGTSWGLHLRK